MKPAVNRLFVLLLTFFAAGASLLRGQGEAPFDYRPATVVVYNENDPNSKDLAEYYIRQRGIPAENLVGLKCSTAETINRALFESTIETPLREVFNARKWWETGRVPKDGLVAVRTRMRVFALMQGMPLRINSTAYVPQKDPATGKDRPAGPTDETAASVDSELTVFGALERPVKSFLPNPYFKSATPFAKTPLAPLFLVGRIDGPDKVMAKRLIDDAIAVEKEGLYGKAYIDLARKEGEGYKAGDEWLINAARMLETRGIPVIMDTWPETLPLNFPMHDCAVYLGWYTQHPDGPFLNPAFRFRRGAVACHIHSFSADTLRSGKVNWCGPLVARGAAGVLGNVYEPYLIFTSALDTFTERLLGGFTLAEAAWCSSRVLSWMNIVVGDPLYRPFAMPPGGGDKKKDAEYKAMRLAMERWGKPEQSGELNDNLERAARSLKNPDIYEFLALHAQAGGVDAWPAAKKWFELAEKSTPDAAGRIRLQFLKADAMRRDGDGRDAVRLLNELVEKNPSAPEAAAARMWIQQIRGK